MNSLISGPHSLPTELCSCCGNTGLEDTYLSILQNLPPRSTMRKEQGLEAGLWKGPGGSGLGLT